MNLPAMNFPCDEFARHEYDQNCKNTYNESSAYGIFGFWIFDFFDYTHLTIYPVVLSYNKRAVN